MSKLNWSKLGISYKHQVFIAVITDPARQTHDRIACASRPHERRRNAALRARRRLLQGGVGADRAPPAGVRAAAPPPRAGTLRHVRLPVPRRQARRISGTDSAARASARDAPRQPVARVVLCRGARAGDKDARGGRERAADRYRSFHGSRCALDHGGEAPGHVRRTRALRAGHGDRRQGRQQVHRLPRSAYATARVAMVCVLVLCGYENQVEMER